MSAKTRLYGVTAQYISTASRALAAANRMEVYADIATEEQAQAILDVLHAEGLIDSRDVITSNTMPTFEVNTHGGKA